MEGAAERAYALSELTSLDRIGGELASFLFYEDLTDVILVATSSGGMIAARAAERAPERIRRLVFVDALVPEGQGGAGLSLHQVLPLVQACGYHALPLSFAETMVVRAVLAHAGREWPDGPVALDAIGAALSAEDRGALHAALTTAQIAGAAKRGAVSARSARANAGPLRSRTIAMT